jgi:hypothetical protein
VVGAGTRCDDQRNLASAVVCEAANQPSHCDFTSVTQGRVTTEGIASEAAPGTLVIFAGTDPDPVLSSPYWAVRTGTVKGRRSSASLCLQLIA